MFFYIFCIFYSINLDSLFQCLACSYIAVTRTQPSSAECQEKLPYQ